MNIKMQMKYFLRGFVTKKPIASLMLLLLMK